MPYINAINRFCYVLCLVCILGGLLVGVLLIWFDFADEVFYKLLMTLVVLMLASALMLSLNKAVHRPPPTDE